jgi:hypothetical protein
VLLQSEGASHGERDIPDFEQREDFTKKKLLLLRNLERLRGCLR